MNSLDSEYSFLAPTWRLPPVGTPSMYPASYDTSYSPSMSKSAPDELTLNNAMYNARYIPPNANRRTHPQQGGRLIQPGPPQQRINEHQYDTPIQSRQNGYPDNGRLNYPPPSQPIQKHVQIIDHNHQTSSTDHMSGGESHDSYTPDFNQNQQQKPKPRRDNIEENRSDSTHRTAQRPNNFKVHEYLYGLSAPDPGSYVSAYKNQRRRLEDEKLTRKSVMTDYKTFVQNGGFGPAFGKADRQTYEEKVDTEKKRKSYSELVRENNQYKIEEHKRIQNNGGQQRNRANALPMPKHRRHDAMRSHFLSAQEVREFEERIKREHAANCKCSLHANPHHASA